MIGREAIDFVLAQSVDLYCTQQSFSANLRAASPYDHSSKRDISPNDSGRPLLIRVY